MDVVHKFVSLESDRFNITFNVKNDPWSDPTSHKRQLTYVNKSIYESPLKYISLYALIFWPGSILRISTPVSVPCRINPGECPVVNRCPKYHAGENWLHVNPARWDLVAFYSNPPA